MMFMMRMGLLLAALFGILYALIVVVGAFLGIGNFLFFGIIAVGLMAVQYAAGPKIVEWSMKVRYVSEEDEPELHAIVRKLAGRAGIPTPRVGVSAVQIPNAFAFGRGRGSSRVCVTDGLRSLLTAPELSAVLGHEISHIKNRDVLIITTISVIPTIAWYLAWSSMFSGNSRGNGALVGMAAFVIYFLTNLLVLYASRIREYYADRGSVRLGQQPHELASALYKLVYGSARLPKQQLKQAEGMKAFFANDPSRAARELTDLKELDRDLSGSIEKEELEQLRRKRVALSRGDRLLELFSTHPNMLKRIGVLSRYGN